VASLRSSTVFVCREALSLPGETTSCLSARSSLNRRRVFRAAPPIAKRFHEIFIDRLKRAYKIGITMAYGTDTFLRWKGKPAVRSRFLTSTALSKPAYRPKILCESLTANAARLLGVDKQRGAIKVGQAADIIATPENPLDNILTLKQVTS